MKKILLLLLVMFGGFALIGCQSAPKNMGLNTVGSLDQLKSLIKDQSRGWFNGPVASEDAVGTPEAGGSTKTSKTNVQVDGIDEGDMVKVDSKRIYQIFGNRLVVTGIENQMTTLLDETLTDEKGRHTYFSELYITTDYLVVIGYTYQYSHWI